MEIGDTGHCYAQDQWWLQGTVPGTASAARSTALSSSMSTSPCLSQAPWWPLVCITCHGCWLVRRRGDPEGHLGGGVGPCLCVPRCACAWLWQLMGKGGSPELAAVLNGYFSLLGNVRSCQFSPQLGENMKQHHLGVWKIGLLRYSGENHTETVFVECFEPHASPRALPVLTGIIR